MAIGPGKYDAEATLARTRANAAGVVLLVLRGDRGSGFSVQADANTVAILPRLLRAVADSIENGD